MYCLVVKIICSFKALCLAKETGSKNHVSTQAALGYFKIVNYSCKKLSEVLSIDEFKGNAGGEKYQTILTAARNKRWWMYFPAKNRVFDTNRYFKEVAQICFPNAKIVIDRYHVVRQAI